MDQFRGGSARGSTGGDEAGLVGDDDELGAISGIEFHHGAVDVGLGGGWADDEPLGDVVVGEPKYNKGQDLALTRGEICERVGCAARGDVGLGEDAGDQGSGRCG